MENSNQVDEFLNKLEKQSQGSPRRQQSKQKAKSNMELVDQILPAVMSGLGLERRLKEHALMQIWVTFLPPVIGSRCRPLFVDHQHNLVVAVSDAAVAQEISLMKSKLMQALQATAKSLGLELKGLRIDMKSYHRVKDAEAALDAEPARFPTVNEAELDAVDLSQYDKQLIVDLSYDLSQNSDFEKDLRVKALKAYERQLRLAQWRRDRGFPICQNCSNPVSRLYELDMLKLCFNCWASLKI